MPATPFTARAQSTQNDALDLKLVFGISLLLSLWLIISDPLINRDGIIYLRAAEAYLRDGLLASQAIFGRPLLSVGMGLLHQLTGLPLLYCGQLIITLSYAFLCCGFVAVIRELGANRSVQIVAALVILTHPMLNEYRSSIMRDPPYWAAIIYAFLALLNYAKQPSLTKQCQWFALVLLASTIRFEGLLYVALAPLALYFCWSGEARLRHVLRLLALPAVSLLLVLAGLWLGQASVDTGTRLFPAISKHLQGIASFPTEFGGIAKETGQALLQFSAKDDAKTAAFAGLIAILGLNLIRAMTWPYTALLGWYFWRGKQVILSRQSRYLLNAHLLIALAYLTLFTLGNRFMLERYSGIFTLFMLPYLCFALYSLWQHGRGSAARIVAVLLIVGMVADTLHNGNYRKAYVREASEWLRDNTSDDIALLSNQRQLIYLSGKPYKWRRGKPIDDRFAVSRLLEAPLMHCGYDYMAIDVRPRAEADWRRFTRRFRLEEHEVFDGGKLGRIVIVDLRGRDAADDRCQRQ
ncbi:MAG: hypothetical protein AAGI11_08665 [Pseudomonadota bacterium]